MFKSTVVAVSAAALLIFQARTPAQATHYPLESIEVSARRACSGGLPAICGRRGRTSTRLFDPSKKLISAPLMREFFAVQVHRRDQSLEFCQAVTCAPRDVTHGPQRGRPVDDLFPWG